MEKVQGRRRHSVFAGWCARAMGLGWSTEVFYSGVILRDSFPSMHTVPIWPINGGGKLLILPFTK